MAVSEVNYFENGGNNGEFFAMTGYVSPSYYYYYCDGSSNPTKDHTSGLTNTFTSDLVNFEQSTHSFTFTFNKKCRLLQGDGTWVYKDAGSTLTIATMYSEYGLNNANPSLCIIQPV